MKGSEIFYMEGNKGGDYIQIESIGENMARLEVGHQCVIVINELVPIEFITAALAQAVFKNGSVEKFLLNTDWPRQYKWKLVEQMK